MLLVACYGLNSLLFALLSLPDAVPESMPEFKVLRFLFQAGGICIFFLPGFCFILLNRAEDH